MQEIDERSVTAGEESNGGYYGVMPLGRFVGRDVSDKSDGAICTSMAVLDPTKTWTPLRDVALRDSILYDGQWAIAVEKAATKFAAHGAEVEGKFQSRIQAAHELITYTNGHEGYPSFLKAIAYDHLLTGNNAILEFVRDTPMSPVQQINILNNHQCERTGDRDFPIKYHRTDGDAVKMAWFNVYVFSDQRGRPYSSRGYICAAQRVYQTVYRRAIINQRKLETDSRSGFNKIVLMSTSIQGSIEDVKNQADEKAKNMGLHYEKGNLIVPSIGDAGAQTAEVDLLPQYDPETARQKDEADHLEFANAVGLRPHELNPALQTLAGLNSGGQRESENEESESTGLADLRNELTHGLTHFAFPAGTTFSMVVPSLSGQMKEQKLKKLRAETRKIQVADIGEITAAEARNMAGDVGDIPAEFNQPDATDGGVMDENDKE